MNHDTAGGASAAPGVSPVVSQCQVSDTQIPKVTTCRGEAWLRASAAGPTLTFDDGSRLIWDSSKLSVPVSEPPNWGTDAERIWVDYLDRVDSWCPFCGSYQTKTIEIRDAEGGALRFVAREGQRVPEVPDSLLSELFGVSTEHRARCREQSVAGCETLTRTEYEHALLTEPEQFIAYAALTRVDTTAGIYDVYWTASDESEPTWNSLCADGPGPAYDNAFFAVRRP